MTNCLARHAPLCLRSHIGLPGSPRVQCADSIHDNEAQAFGQYLAENVTALYTASYFTQRFVVYM